MLKFGVWGEMASKRVFLFRFVMPDGMCVEYPSKCPHLVASDEAELRCLMGDFIDSNERVDKFLVNVEVSRIEDNE